MGELLLVSLRGSVLPYSTFCAFRALSCKCVTLTTLATINIILTNMEKKYLY